MPSFKILSFFSCAITYCPLQLPRAVQHHCQRAHIKCKTVTLSSPCRPPRASQGSYTLFLDPPGPALSVAWLPNIPTNPTIYTGLLREPLSWLSLELFPTKHLLLRTPLLHLEDPRNPLKLHQSPPNILRSCSAHSPLDSFCISHTLKHSHSIVLGYNANFRFSVCLARMKPFRSKVLPRAQLMAHP